MDRAVADAAAGAGQAPAVFVAMDVHNLKGVAGHLGEGKERPHATAMLKIAAEELGKAGAVRMFRPGGSAGDEFGAVVTGADRAAVERAVESARRRVAGYARANGLHEIPHTKP